MAGTHQGTAFLYRLEIEQDRCLLDVPDFGRAPQIRVGPASQTVPSGLLTDVGATPEETLQRMLAIQRAVAKSAANVGAPFDCVIIRTQEAPRVWREDA